MHALSGYLEFPEDQRDRPSPPSATSARAVARTRAASTTGGPRTSRHPTGSASSSAGSPLEAFEAHQAQPYEAAFMAEHVSRITGFDAHILDIPGRRPVLGG